MAVLVEAATDNRNRTAAEVRSMFTKAGGQLAGSGAVAWQFEPRGLITVPRAGQDPDEVALAAIDAGAEDVDTDDDDRSRSTRRPAELEAVRKALEGAGVAGRIGRVDDDRQADRRARRRRRRARTCASSSCSRTSTTSSASPPNFDIPEEVFAEVAG